MRNLIKSILLGIVGFSITYLGLCYLVPGWRIKLEAEPIVYFVESIKSMAFIKCLISAVVGMALTALPFSRTGGRKPQC